MCLISFGFEGRVSPYVSIQSRVVSLVWLARWQNCAVEDICLPSMYHLASALVKAAGPYGLWKRYCDDDQEEFTVHVLGALSVVFLLAVDAFMLVAMC